MNKDSKFLAEAYKKIHSDPSSFSIGNELYRLSTELEPNSKARADVEDILNELKDILKTAKDNADHPGVLDFLLKKLSLD